MKSPTAQKFTLLTGASAGLGKALAEECARRGMNLILVSLAGDQLPVLGERLRRNYGVTVYCYETDLTLPQAPLKLAAHVKEKFSVNMLINNAGIGGSMPIEQASAGYIDNILQLNIRALSLLTHQFVPELKKHDRAYILNVSSLAAFSPIPYKTVYPASKAFVHSFSQSLRAELRHAGIGVTVLNPGPILTNPDIIRRIQEHGWLGRLSALTPERTAREAIRGLLRNQAVIIPGAINKLSFLLMKLAPVELRLRVLSRMLRQEIQTKPGRLKAAGG